MRSDVSLCYIRCRHIWRQIITNCRREAATISPAPVTLKVMSESRVTWATSVPILVFLGLSVLVLGPMYATDRLTDVRQHHRLMPPPIGGEGIITATPIYSTVSQHG